MFRTGKDFIEGMESVHNNLTLLKAEARVSSSHDQLKLLGWNVAPEDLKQIPVNIEIKTFSNSFEVKSIFQEHWLSYQEPEASLHYLLALVYIAFTFFSLTGNGLVIYVFTA